MSEEKPPSETTAVLPPVTLTLRAKEQSLLETVALPSTEKWQLLEDHPGLVERLNTILLEGLAVARRGNVTYGSIAKAVYGPLEVLRKQYPGAGLEDSETRQVIARFFGANDHPSMFHFMRYADLM